MKALLPALAALLALTGPAAAQRPAAPPARTASDWTRLVERTPEGGYRMGDPAAPMKLVEYGSVACPHCAEFASEAGAPLRALVRTGRISFEYRPFAIFPSDPALFVLLDCQAPGKFFDTLDKLYRQQDAWRARIDARRSTWRGLTGPAQAQAMMRAADVDALFALTPQRRQACLADAAAYQRLQARGEIADRLGVSGTPTFFLNGRPIEPASWADLERMLTAG